MKAVINESVVSLTFKPSEKDRVEGMIMLMCSEVNSMCIMEVHETEAVLCYSSDEITVIDVKKSYSDAKKATK
ncbi:hypothetical protein VPHK406_0129 [Vibrio phage K406]